MIFYKNVVAVYIDESNKNNLINLCNENNFEFAEGRMSIISEEYYRKETGISGKVIRCYITNRTNYKNGYDDIFNALETLDFTIMVNHEIS